MSGPRQQWPTRSAGKRRCPACGCEAPVFFPVYSVTLVFKNHKDASHVDYCRNSRAMVLPKETR